MKCATPLPAGDHTLAPDHTLATGGEGWSLPVADGIVTAGVPKPLGVGTVLGERYEIVKLLGQGGMGAVYHARDRELEREVALKVIRSDMAANPEILRRFKQELILARQDHPQKCDSHFRSWRSRRRQVHHHGVYRRAGLCSSLAARKTEP